MLTGTSVPYDLVANNLVHRQDQDRVHSASGTTTMCVSTSASAGSSSSLTLRKNVPIKAIVFTEESLPCNDTGVSSAHLRPATPSALRPGAPSIGRVCEDEEDCSLPSPPPPPSIQSVPVMQLQALHLHQPVPQYQQNELLHESDLKKHNVASARSCFSPPPTSIVAQKPPSSGVVTTGAAGTSRQLSASYSTAMSAAKSTPIWITPEQHPAGVSSSSRERPVTAPTNLYSIASTITVATGSNCPAVVSNVPVLRTFGASAGAKRQNSFGS